MIYFIPVPIGNIEDITLRAKRLLETVDVLIVEDGRVTNKLFEKIGITTKPKMVNIISHHNYNQRQVDEVIKNLRSEKISSIGVVSDAGTPGLSDPGFEIIATAKDLGIPYTVLPGANALVPAVVASGLVGKSFTYHGFLPIKKGRQTLFESFKEESDPIVFYESVHRIKKTLSQLSQVLSSDQKVFIGRELSKQFEEYIHSTIGEVNELEFTEKGEFVVIIAPKKTAKK